MFLEFPFEYGTIPGIGRLFYPIIKAELKTIIGWRKFEFLVDTGADLTTIPTDLLSLLGHRKNRLKTDITSGVGGIKIKTWELQLSLKLGEQELSVSSSAVDAKSKFPSLLLGRKDILDGPFNLTIDSQRQVTVLSPNYSSASS